MKLKNLTEKQIERFAGSTIYNRGYDYYLNDNVCGLDYDPDAEAIHAEVCGNYGDYQVVVTLDEGEDIEASCNCPYDGYPCKHIVAALLTFIHRHEEYTAMAVERRRQWAVVESRIRKLPKEDLVGMIMSCARKYSDFERELVVRFQPNQGATLEMLLKQVARAFPPVTSDAFSASETSGELSRILRSVESAPVEMKVEVNRAAADAILHELNEYGMNDDFLEDVLLEALDNLTAGLAGNDHLVEKKREIIGFLMDYYNWGNCGVVDSIYQTVMDLCSEKADYELVIEKLGPADGGGSYKRTLLASLYAKTGNEAARLKILQEGLEYGMDYWRLAGYWIERGDSEKALEVVREGIDKAKGRKTELYAYLQQHLESRNDYSGLLQLLRAKVERSDIDYGGLRRDPIYKSLKRHYASQKDYNGQVKLLRMCLTHDEIDLDLYREAEQTLNGKDWKEFERNIMSRLKEPPRGKRESLPAELNNRYTAQVLAEIHDYRNEPEKLFQVVKNYQELLLKYAPKLVSLHPEFYIKNYRAMVDGLIKLRGRENYQVAAGHLKALRGIYEDVVGRPEEWKEYVEKLRSENKKLRALQDELRLVLNEPAGVGAS